MRAGGGYTWVYALSCSVFLVVGFFIGGVTCDWSSDGPSLREACTNAYDYGDPTCLGNSTLYWGTGNDTDLSCAHCMCDEGWGGVDCGRCLDVSVCPSTTVGGKTLAATNCSADTLLLTEEEARSEQGKVFSCSCGGGEDGWTDFLCLQQPDTWIQWAVTGGGTEHDPAVVIIKEYAGIHARTEEEWPDQYRYHYPKIFDGSAGPCKVYRDKCLPVDGTDVGERACVIFECGDTEGRCPPEEYPMCDGFPNCKSPSGQKYETHPCTAVPQGGKSITIACQEEKVNGSHVCYYQQPGAFALLSMTCSVGSCLYEGGTPVQPSGSKTKIVSWSIGTQMAMLISLAGLLLMSFVAFSFITDPGTAASAVAKKTPPSVSNTRTPLGKRLLGSHGPDGDDQDEEGAWEGQDLRTPLLPGEGNNGTPGSVGRGASPPRAPPEGIDGDRRQVEGLARESSNSSVYTISLDGGGGARGDHLTGAHPMEQAALLAGGDRAQPAVLRWNKLGYYVRGGERGGVGGEKELAVLRGVSGFAGPELGQDAAAARGGGGGVAGSAPGVGERATIAAAPARPEGAADGTSSSSGDYCGGVSPPGQGRGCVPSTITGILGPSGAGKSSLLDLLAGRKRRGEGRATGSITLEAPEYDRGGRRGGRGGGGGGRWREGESDAERGADAVRRVGGYVCQEDVLPGTLTCYEHLMFHARLRMPPGASFAERAARVLWVIEELGLTRVADSRIGDELERGLSGGERRRLSIAAELVAQPALLFLDEPTTGLDAATALRVMTLIKGVASRGTTVLCSLHQPRPRVLNLLDKVILLSKGRVAFFGRPGEAEPYFLSVGRPFPPGQPHPADAMLALCCREDGGDLPSLFRRSSLGSAANAAGSSSSPPAAAAVAASANVRGGGGGGGTTDMPVDGDEEEPLQQQQQQQQQPAFSSSGSLSSSGGTAVEETELVGVERRRWGRGRGTDRRGKPRTSGGGAPELSSYSRRQRQPYRGGAKGGDGAGSAPFFVQVEALSRRLLLRAMRHPLLLVLHFGGSIAMALCLSSVFWGRLGFNLEGAQNRFGVLFFLLLYLSLLSLTSLPVWREDRRLFLTESMGGAYGHLPYFASVALADILLVRVLPPLAFAVVGYPLIGLNSSPDNQNCLLWFAGILVLANVTVALAAMAVGALGLPLDLSNLVGGLMVLLLAAFGRFLLNGTRIPLAWRWLSSVTPLGHAFEALLINEFSDADGTKPYRIEGSHCSPDLPVIEPLGPQILATFSFSPDRSTMHVDVVVLVCLAFALAASSLLIFFSATRTKPLVVDDEPSGMRVPARSIRGRAVVATPLRGNPPAVSGGQPGGRSSKYPVRRATPIPTAARNSNNNNNNNNAGQSPDVSAQRRRTGRRTVRDRNGGGGAVRRTVHWNDVELEASGGGANGGSGGGGGGGTDRPGARRVRLSRGGGASRSPRPGVGAAPARPPLLLSWEALRYSVALPRTGRWLGRSGGGGGEATNNDTTRNSATGTGSKDHLLILDGVSGFAGPKRRGEGVPRDSNSEEAGRPSVPAASVVEGNAELEEGAEEGWAGTVTAIMGPSGAGKTSLLNALAGRLQTVSGRTSGGGGRGDGAGGGGSGLTGSVRLDGEAVGPEQVRRVSAYVTQEDVLPETLTCYEHLMFHAHLRLPTGTPLQRRHCRVMEVLQHLGLGEIWNSRIGGGLTRGVSGGEKRRLSIATEILTRPALLFLDEPTTGLDSSTALRVMQLVVSRVASRGTTVLCSVHQPRPEVVSLLDKVILLSRGAVAFSGPPGDAEAHFASIGHPFLLLPGETSGDGAGGVNPTDSMLDALGQAEASADRGRRGVCGVEGRGEGNGERNVSSNGGLVVMPRELLVEQVRAAERLIPPQTSPIGQQDLAAAARESPPVSTQLNALLRRSALNVARDPYLAWLHIVLTLCVGLVVGSLFRDLTRLNGSTAGVQDRLGVVFLLLLYLSLLCLTSLAAWRKQMSLFVHERASGAYGPAAHLAAAAAVDAIACRILPPILLATTVRPLAGLREGSLGGLVGGLVAFNLSLAAVLAACGAGAKSSQEALALGCLVVLFSALLSGFLVSKDDLPAAWGALAWLSPVGRGFEALVANEFSPYGAVFKLSTKIGSVMAYTELMTGDEVLHCFGFNGGRYFADLGVLAAVGACGLALAFVFLKRSR